MTNLKKLVMTVAMMGFLVAGFTTAKAGILLTDSASNNAQTTTEAKDDKGVIILTLTESIILSLTGVIILT
jgi:hypothetical protein